MSLNKVMILGRLGQDPELKYTPGGQPVCNFSVATSEYWLDKSGQKQERTEWHRIIVWGKQAEHCNQYLGKGRMVYVEGRLQTRSWDGQDGQKRYTTEIVAQNVQFLDRGNSETASRNQSTNNQTQSYSNSGNNQFQNSSNNASNSNIDRDYEISVDANYTTEDVPF